MRGSLRASVFVAQVDLPVPHFEPTEVLHGHSLASVSPEFEREMGQSGVLDEGMQLSFFVHAMACKFNLAQFLYVAPVPVIFVVFVVVASNEAAA